MLRKTITALLVMLFVVSVPALADTRWIGGTGSWDDSANWDGGVPLDNIAHVNNGGTAQILTGPKTFYWLQIGDAPSGSSTVTMSGDATLYLYWLLVGNGAQGSSGTLIQNGGSIVRYGWPGNGPITLVGANGGTGTYLLNGGSLTTMGMGVSNASSVTNSALHIFAGATSVAGGSTYQLSAGTITGNSNDLNIGDSSSQGYLKGYGTISGVVLHNSGQVTAQSIDYQDRSLTISGSADGQDAAFSGTKGWWAVSHGKLQLPDIQISADGTYNWGENAGNTSLSMVNAAWLSFTGVGSAGSLTGKLVASDCTDLRALPLGSQMIGIWDFSATCSFSSVVVKLRYDASLASSQGIAESALKLYSFNGTAWTDVTGSIDTANHIITSQSMNALSRLAVAGNAPSGITGVKTSPENAQIACTGVVSAVFSDCFYVESSDRTSGTRVNKADSGLTAGQNVSIVGSVSTLASGERCIVAASITPAGYSPVVKPFAMNNKALGGGAFGLQGGVSGGFGLNNIGLLVKTTGRVTSKDTSANPAWFDIDDGSGVSVKVYGSVPSGTPYVIITGVCSCENTSGTIVRVIRATEIAKVAEQFWQGNQIGNEEIVPFPFTPVMVVSQNPLVIGVWGRQVTFAEGPLPSKMTSASRDLLASPSRLILNGAAVTGFTTQLEEARGTLARISGTATVGQTTIRMSTVIEYDGLMYVEMDVSTQPGAIESLSLNIPMASDVATFRHLPPWDTNNHYAGLTAPPTGREYVGPSIARNDSTPGWNWHSPFVYNIWIGDTDRGLTFLCESAEGWNGDSTRQIELTRTDSAMLWKLNFIQSPWNGSSYRVQFGLHPTPMRPQPRRPKRILAPGYGSDVGVAWASPAYTLYHGYPKAPLSMEAIGLQPEQSIDALVSSAHESGRRVFSYLHVAMLSEYSPEFASFGSDWRVPGTQFNWVPDNFHVLSLEGSPPDCITGMCPNSEWSDFQVAMLKDYITKHNIDGLHLDFCAPWVCTNTSHGCRPGYMPIMAWRKMLKRIYVMASQLQRPFVISQHTSINSGIMSSALLSFADTFVENENVSCWASGFGENRDWPMTRIPLEYYLVRLTGRQLGLRGITVFAYGYQFSTAAAVMLLHDLMQIWPYTSNPPTTNWLDDWWRLYQILGDFGVNDNGVDFVGYWDNAGLVAAGDECTKISYYRHPTNGILMTVANFSDVSRNITVNLSPLQGSGWQIRDMLNNSNITANANQAVIPVAGYNFVLLYLQSTPAQ